MTKRILAMMSLVVASACGLDKQGAPALSGPSEFGLSLTVTASPDVITQDGVAQTTLAVVARDSNSQPVPFVGMHIDTLLEGSAVDYGTLTTRNLSTGSDGRAQVTYTAPPPPPPTVTSDTTLTFRFTPVGTNYANASPRYVELHLLRPGVLTPPPPAGLAADFSFVPNDPVQGTSVIFDASTSTAPSGRVIVSYAWSFGDGGSASGAITPHEFRTVGSFPVMLRVTDDLGRVATTTKAISVKDNGLLAGAAFVVSPTDPHVGQVVNFNASTTVVPPGRSIVDYEWDFGNGKTGHGVVASITYEVAVTYTVVLKIRDDLGNVATISKPLAVGK